MMRRVITGLLLVLLAACTRAPLPEVAVQEKDPDLLSAWGILSRDAEIGRAHV